VVKALLCTILKTLHFDIKALKKLSFETSTFRLKGNKTFIELLKHRKTVDTFNNHFILFVNIYLYIYLYNNKVDF